MQDTASRANSGRVRYQDIPGRPCLPSHTTRTPAATWPVLAAWPIQPVPGLWSSHSPGSGTSGSSAPRAGDACMMLPHGAAGLSSDVQHDASSEAAHAAASTGRCEGPQRGRCWSDDHMMRRKPLLATHDRGHAAAPSPPGPSTAHPTSARTPRAVPARSLRRRYDRQENVLWSWRRTRGAMGG